MTAKLLEKSRNIFLSLTPPENLIAKKRVKANKRNSYQKNSLKNSTRNSLNKFFHEKRHISHVYKSNRLALEDLSLENKNIIAPRDHSATDELHFAIGGNINRFLNTQPVDERKNSELSAPLLKKAATENLHHKGEKLHHKGEKLTCLERNTSISPFFLRWNPGNLFLTNFIKGRLYENIWKSLFSSYDLNYVYNAQVKNYKAPLRIKNQHKNELMEYRKIAIFYGNLSRNYLYSLMNRSGGSNFLSTLERRLDVVLKRALFFPTIRGARQWIYQGKILVNNEICMYNSYLLQPGDLISIKERDKNIWRKEWLKNFKEALFLREKGAHTGETFQNPMGYPPFKRGRFLFPPHLMRKWNKWCQLWGNSILPRKGGHPWSKQPYTWNLSLHPVFNNSVCADNLYLNNFMRLKNNMHKVRYTGRQPTPILFWLEELYKNSYARKNMEHYMLQLISSLLLLQQRGRVIDGLFPQRWNRLFTRKKQKILKKKNCQWGGIKPMHLECSYSCATVIYLFTPQKLVWPSRIDVLLLKSTLKS